MALDTFHEVKLNGTWVDITDRARITDTQAATGSRGLGSWAASADPAKWTFQFDNRDAEFSPYNATSTYFGQLNRYTPLRVSVPSAYGHLEILDTSGSLSTPHSDALNIAGDLDVRVEADLDLMATAKNQTIIGKWSSTLAEKQWLLRVYKGVLVFNFTDADGSTEHTAFQNIKQFGGRVLRVTLDADTGSGNWAVQFWQGDDWSGTWTAVSQVLSASGTGVQSVSSGPLAIGVTDTTSTSPDDRLPFTGFAHRVQVRRGIKGLIVADLDLAAAADSATTVTDTVGNVWTLSGNAQIRRRDYLFTGEIGEWPEEIDDSGRDATVTVTAQSRARREGTDTDPLTSAITRRVTSYAPVAYWPCEDGSDSARIYSPVDGVAPMSVANMSLAAESSMPGSAALPVVATQSGAVVSRMIGAVPAGSSSSAWSVYWLYKMGSAPASYASYMSVQCASGTVRDWRIQFSTAGTRVLGLDENGAAVVSQLIGTGADLFGQWIMVRFYASETAGTITWGIVWTDIGGDPGTFSTTYAGTLGRVSAVGSPATGWNSLVDGLALGHISVWDATSTDAYDSSDSFGDILLGYAGEFAAERMIRLARENQIPLAVRAKVKSTERVGAQPLTSFLDTLKDAATADGGILLDQRSRSGYLYLAPSALENLTPAVTLSYAAPGHVLGVFKPVSDDQYLENDSTVTRNGGSSGRYVKTSGSLNVNSPDTDADGIGRKAKQTTLNLYQDEQCEPLAAWRVHLGTWNQARFPSVTVDASRLAATFPQLHRLDVGDVLCITDVPTRHSYDDLYLLILGVSVSRTRMRSLLTFNCVPYGPWDTAIAGTSSTTTTGSTLAAGASATDTSLQVTSEAALWATTAGFPDDFPLDVMVAGERMTLTGVDGTSNPQTFHVVRSVNGVVKAQAASAAVSLFHEPYVALAE